MGAFTGTWNNSANNNNITVTASGNAFNGSGSGTRTINLGSATYTVTGSAATFTFATATNLTLSAASSNIVFSPSASGNYTFTSGSSLTWGNLTFGAASGAINYRILGSSLTFNSITVTAPNLVRFGASTTSTVATFTASGNSGNEIGLLSDTIGTTATLALTTATITRAAIRDLDFTGSPSATSSFDLGNNSGIVITGPPTGGSGGIIGG